MHSLWIGESILQMAFKQAEEYRGKRIRTVSVKIRDENFVESDWLRFCLEVAGMGTIAEGARIDIELVASTASGEVTPAMPPAEKLFEVAVEVD